VARPRWGQVRRFCEAQGYSERLTDHHYYDKILPDGSRSGTKVSLGKDGEELRPGRWQEVWRHQLRLAREDEFWRGLEGQVVAYDIPSTPDEQAPLPDYLLLYLRDVLHYSDERITATSRDKAEALLYAYYSRELSDPFVEPPSQS
jgi:hypothetical protein